MTISFNIHFHTLWGQSLCIAGSIPELGNWDSKAAIQLEYKDEGLWSVEVDIPDKYPSFQYRYYLLSNREVILEEWDKNHSLQLPPGIDAITLHDYWQSPPKDLVFYSSAFTKGFFAHSFPNNNPYSANDLVIKVWAPFVQQGQRPALCGNQKTWKNWKEPQLFHTGAFPEWEIRIDRASVDKRIEFKLCIIDGDKLIWEEGEDRVICLPDTDEMTMVSGLFYRNPAIRWKCAGVAIPVFSLRSEQNFGIGEFPDLKKMVDWAKLTGQKIIQVLPINDTTAARTWQDSYPYNAISIYALNPLYLNLRQMGTLSDSERRNYYNKKQLELNGLSAIDYDEVCNEKWNYFKEIYAQDKEETLESAAFEAFFSANKEWLIPYAAYCFLRDSYNSVDFHRWEDYAVYNKEKAEKLVYRQEKEIFLYIYIQFHLHLQLSEAKEYALKNGVILKGDIPIGVSRNSVETWKEPYYFRLDYQAGAPPDDFSITGQNWQFPTYNWQAMENDNYRWWRNRFRKMADYFSAYRIDHILGFFRIWQIPVESKEGLLGFFHPALPLSIEEIESAGLKFRKEHFIRANINQAYLEDLFGEYTSEVRQIYFNRVDAAHFELKEQVSTQQKISLLIASDDEKSRRIRTGLFIICNEVLFIEDPDRPDYYHPRISASGSLIYQDLDGRDKYAFDYLYWNYFYSRQNDFWKDEALKRLTPLVHATDMLACGEDLGMIPHSVPEVMEKLQILSLEIERMPKSEYAEFTLLQHLPYLSVCTTSTHDMSTLRGWWKENKERTQLYYNLILKREGDAPEEASPDICRQIISNHLASSAIFCIIPFQDWLSIDWELRNPNIEGERINLPSSSRHYWRYRMHITIEELLEAEQLNNNIREMIQAHRD